MKASKRHWLVAGALGTMFLAGCASEAYVGTDDGYYHRHHHYYHHRYEGRPPGYYRGEGVGVYVAPEPPHRW